MTNHREVVNLEDKWTFEDDTHWVNSCDKCCVECGKDSKTCENHCLNVFNDCFCGGCKYDE